jgi:exopolyphosphatase/guanosine-5'-triphosphate,3'-diphosphate pyrophosphatase
LQEEHGLGRRERRLLQVAALLHDVGMFISNQSHHKHSEYIIRNSEIFGLRPEERNLVATIARYHRRALPKPTHPAYTTLSRKDRAVVSKVAAILRVADGLDRGHSRKFQDMEVKIGREDVVLRLLPHDDLTLERLAMRGKADMFEEVFGRKINLQS